jgi:oxygen-independent coproporphyrinogen-3 oxidase
MAVKDRLDPRACAEERLLMGLRTDEGVARSDIAVLTLRHLPDLVEAGMIEADSARLRATPAGRLLLDRVTQMLAD